ncbi:MAG: hypothetical protein MJZ12_00120 [Prevotella sp.]|nr:hypothetical protein [Prevotella sp.]
MDNSIKERANTYQCSINSDHGCVPTPNYCRGIIDGYIAGATEQKAIDSKMFDEFLCSLRNGNMWEGREWRFQRMWREFVENYIAMEE